MRGLFGCVVDGCPRASYAVIWGSRDDFFTTPGAFAYLRDAPQAEVHVIDSGHFATLDKPEVVADLVSSFLGKNRSVIEERARGADTGARGGRR